MLVLKVFADECIMGLRSVMHWNLRMEVTYSHILMDVIICPCLDLIWPPLVEETPG